MHIDAGARPPVWAADEDDFDSATRNARTVMWGGVIPIVVMAVGICLLLAVIVAMFVDSNPEAVDGGSFATWRSSFGGLVDPQAALVLSPGLFAVIVTVNVAVSLARNDASTLHEATLTSLWAKLLSFQSMLASVVCVVLAVVVCVGAGLPGHKDAAVAAVVVPALFSVGFAATVVVSDQSGAESRRSLIDARRQRKQFDARRRRFVQLSEGSNDRRRILRVFWPAVVGFVLTLVATLVLDAILVGSVSGMLGFVAIQAFIVLYAQAVVWYLVFLRWTSCSKRDEERTKIPKVLLALMGLYLILIPTMSWLYGEGSPIRVIAASSAALGAPPLIMLVLAWAGGRRARGIGMRRLGWFASSLWHGIDSSLVSTASTLDARIEILEERLARVSRDQGCESRSERRR
ncbi:hypothetical protein [Rhodococcus sp. NPDC058521]|uniref:hypothetical protein n=1 Tax=Rhodococcus sp. NPDC058521 TaxID=3346536 RepID=UPI0036604D88